MTELTRRSFLAGAAAVATAPVVGTAHAKDTKVPRPDVKADYPAAGKTQALFDRVPDVEPDVANSGTFDFGVSNLNEGETITATRWGIVRPVVKGGRVVELKPFEYDYAPSPNIQGLAEIPYCEARIRYPMVRESYLKSGPKSKEKRGEDKFVRVSWDKALELVAKELTRMYDTYGPSSVYGSSYGWKSTGSVNDPCALQYRLLNFMGGFTAKRNSYSSAAVNTILPYVVGSGNPRCTAWDNVIEHSERIVFWGCNPLVTNDIDWYTTLHNYAGYMRALKKKGTKTYSVNPVYNDTAEYMKSEWVVVAAEIAGLRTEGSRLFAAIPERYERLRALAQQTAARPRVMLNTPYRDTWFMPARNSYMVRLLEDAGARYVFEENTATQTLPIDIEQAYYLTSKSDFWLNVSGCNTLDEVRRQNPRLADTPPVREGRVYDNNRRRNAAGGSDFWESGVLRPDRVLADLVHIFHPELSETDELYYYRQLE